MTQVATAPEPTALVAEVETDIGPVATVRPVPGAARPVRVRQMPVGWRRVALVGSLTLFGPLCIDMYLPALPDISRQLHSSASAVQLTLTACLIGISGGQLLLGPISDRLGRRPPLLVGLAGFIISSVACGFAPNIYVLAGCRVVQGVGGAAGLVITRSIVRDLHSGVALVRFFSTLMLVTGLGPVLAPQIGSWALSFTSWRGIFLILAGFGLILLVSAWWRIPETLPPERRSSGSAWSAFSMLVSVGRDRVFLGSALACGLGMSGAFAYISGSSFVLQNVYGVSPQIFGLLFAFNACGLIAGAQINGRLAARFGPAVLLTFGLLTMGSSGALLLTIVSTHVVGLAGVMPTLFAVMFGFGFVGPNSSSLALERYPHSAGSASAVLGSFQFVLASVAAPLAGIAGTADAIPMALLITTLPLAGLVGRILLVRPSPSGPIRSLPEPVLATLDRP